jgi:hypothetical protein
VDTITDRTQFSTREACDLAGITYRQADYWARIGLIEPDAPARGSGSRRRWNRHQVLMLATIAQAGSHVLPGRMGQLVAVLTDCDTEAWRTRKLLVDGQGNVWLPSEPGAPPVTTRLDLAGVVEQVRQRATELGI